MGVESVGNSYGNPAPQQAIRAAEQPPAAAQQPSGAEPPRPGSKPEDAEAPAGRTHEELEQLADDVLSILDDSPERLEQLVATLKRLENANS